MHASGSKCDTSSPRLANQEPASGPAGGWPAICIKATIAEQATTGKAAPTNQIALAIDSAAPLVFIRQPHRRHVFASDSRIQSRAALARKTPARPQRNADAVAH